MNPETFPTEGGSYIRDAETGEITRVEPAPEPQPAEQSEE